MWEYKSAKERRRTMGQEKMDRVDETLISQDIDPAELEDPVRQKTELAEDMEGM